jgi:hypothetical protein
MYRDHHHHHHHSTTGTDSSSVCSTLGNSTRLPATTPYQQLPGRRAHWQRRCRRHAPPWPARAMEKHGQRPRAGPMGWRLPPTTCLQPGHTGSVHYASPTELGARTLLYFPLSPFSFTTPSPTRLSPPGATWPLSRLRRRVLPRAGAVASSHANAANRLIPPTRLRHATAATALRLRQRP